jgi:hypothetical protein
MSAVSASPPPGRNAAMRLVNPVTTPQLSALTTQLNQNAVDLGQCPELANRISGTSRRFSVTSSGSVEAIGILRRGHMHPFILRACNVLSPQLHHLRPISEVTTNLVAENQALVIWAADKILKGPDRSSRSSSVLDSASISYTRMRRASRSTLSYTASLTSKTALSMQRE